MKFLIVADLKPYGLAKPNREKKKKKKLKCINYRPSPNTFCSRPTEILKIPMC